MNLDSFLSRIKSKVSTDLDLKSIKSYKKKGFDTPEMNDRKLSLFCYIDRTLSTFFFLYFSQE